MSATTRQGEDFPLKPGAVRPVLDALIETLADWVVLKDADDRWQRVNPAATAALGIEELAWHGQCDQDLAIAQPELGELFGLLARHAEAAWRQRAPHFSQDWVSLADGRRRCYQFHHRPFHTARGHRQCLLLIAHDVTERELAAQRGLDRDGGNPTEAPSPNPADTAHFEVSELILRQIGQELHDDLGQLLASSALLIEQWLNEPPAEAITTLQDKARRLAGWLREAMDRTRLISQGLYPLELEESDLGTLLQSLMDNTRRIAGIEATLIREGPEPALDKEARVHLFRIAQEGVSNIIRHSGATRMVLTLNHGDDTLTLTLTDDGIGIGHDRRRSRRRGAGLRNMHYRARLIGARLDVEARREGGTCLQLVLPLTPPRSA